MGKFWQVGMYFVIKDGKEMLAIVKYAQMIVMVMVNVKTGRAFVTKDGAENNVK